MSEEGFIWAANNVMVGITHVQALPKLDKPKGTTH